MKNKELSVRLNGYSVGILKENSSGKLQFSYIANGIPISHSLPYSLDRVFTEKECKPFFDGLLPDSEMARKRLAEQHRVSSQNTFRLLDAIGKEGAGAISFHKMGEPDQDDSWRKTDVHWVDDISMENHIRQLPLYPLLNGTKDVRLSLAGVQNKACIHYDTQSEQGHFGITRNGSPSTHILKPEIENYPHSAYNEYFCLKLAEAINLKTSRVNFRKVNQTPCVIVERYDRKEWLKGEERHIKRIHQEDFCQAFGKLSSNKYQKEGGPSIKDCFSLLGQMGGYILLLERIRLVEYIVFNFLVGNVDAHGKNYSIIYNSTGDHVTREEYKEYDSMTPQLAPLYDVVCCQIYPQLSSKMAMKIGSEYDQKKVDARQWENFCKSVGLSFPEFKKMTRKMCERILNGLDNLKNLHVKEILHPFSKDDFERDMNTHKEHTGFREELANLLANNIRDFKNKIDN